MTKEELFTNLGTIARSGSKRFLEEIKNSDAADKSSNIIGQFGVGFYSSFMVANKVDVFTRSAEVDSIGYHWSSDGTSSYEVKEFDNVDVGTKIVVQLKAEYRQFANENTVKGTRIVYKLKWCSIFVQYLFFQTCFLLFAEVITKYCNFVERDIIVNGEKHNNFQALWLWEPKDVTQEQHEKFYRFVANSYDEPRFTLHYKVRDIIFAPSNQTLKIYY